ncbi:response regulator [Cellulomonas citrea]|uniref:response regulator n=1 Tax=Cellulomonas citrea TaxID=1909423 RepID=UPI001356C394|nr:response regulator transcription factor [Cellulomonas citrea]
MTRVVVADDEALVRAGLSTILDAHPSIEVVGQAADGREAVELTRALDPDVVCLDVQMPRLDGLAATRELVGDPTVRAAVVILTTFHREDYLLAALQAGACGFLLKTSRPAQLTDAVLAAAAGDGLLSPEVTRAVIAQAVVGSRRRVDEPDDGLLTEREREVLVLMAHGLSNEEIAGRLVLSRATVKTHVSNLLAKLGLRDRVQAVVYAYEHGLVG